MNKIILFFKKASKVWVSTLHSKQMYSIPISWKSFYHIYPTPPLGQDITQGQFFKQSLTGLNSVILLLD